MTDLIDHVRMGKELLRDEGNRLRVYDDATGLPIVPGTTVRGHPTIGAGRSLDLMGLRPFEVLGLLDNDIAEYLDELVRVPWFVGLDPARRRAIVNARHALGMQGLLGFHDMIAALEQGDFDAAADAMLASNWARQEATRVDRAATLLRDGDEHDGAPIA